MAKILVIDNYDSFVHNLSRYFAELGVEPCVVRNDAITVGEIQELAPRAIVLSPGPCTPKEAGICEAVISAFGPDIPLLGVCLGHQAIATACGGALKRAHEPIHGRTSQVYHQGKGLFAGCPSPLMVMRYHSLIIDEQELSPELNVTARTKDDTVMAVAHKHWPVYGVQFHPESILTDCGHRLLANFLAVAGIESKYPAELYERQLHDQQLTDDFYARAISPDAHRPQ